MRASGVVLFVLVVLRTGLAYPDDPHALMQDGKYGSVDEPMQAEAATIHGSLMELAAGGKLGDKYLAGKAGGRYGIGSSKNC
ncbi:MAG: hypothetical protein ACREOG_12775 [Gemmatimonadaceae bacterium]